MDPTYPFFPVFSFMGFILAIIPLSWHLQAWNAGTCAYMLWASLASLIEFINAIIWKGDALNRAPVWCDISSKILLGAGVGIPASSMCISRRLYNIAAIQTVTTTRRDKQKALIGDICIAIGIPLLVMGLHYVVQGHRFDVLEQIGCYPYVYNTLPAYFLVLSWPLLLGCISFVYSVLTLRAFWKRRTQFAELISANVSLSVSRYMRLMLLAVIEMCCTIPFSVFMIYIDTKGNAVQPWISWEDTHFNFSHVDEVPAIVWRSDSAVRISIEVTRYLYPACGILFFLLFGFANEAQKMYGLVFWWVAKRFGFKPQSAEQKSPLLPSMRPKAGAISPPPYVCPSSSDRKSRTDSIPDSLASMILRGSIDIEKISADLSCDTSVSSLNTIQCSSSESSDCTFIGGAHRHSKSSTRSDHTSIDKDDSSA